MKGFLSPSSSLQNPKPFSGFHISTTGKTADVSAGFIEHLGSLDTTCMHFTDGILICALTVHLRSSMVLSLRCDAPAESLLLPTAVYWVMAAVGANVLDGYLLS